MKSANPENEYIPLDLRISVRRDTLRLISEMAQDMGISINEVFSFLAEDSVIDPVSYTHLTLPTIYSV